MKQLKLNEEHPFWLKVPLILIGLCLVVVIMIYGKFILMPLVFAAFFAMILNPVIRFFEFKKVGRVFSIIVALFLVMIVVGGILTLITTQFVQFADRVPEVTEKLKTTSAEAIQFLERATGMSEATLTAQIKDGLQNFIDTSGEFLSSFISATTGTITFLTLVPIFVFFMLYYKEMYRTFFEKLLERSSNSQIDSVIEKIQKVTQNYLVGLIAVMGILAVLNTIGLFIIGLEYFVFFGVFAAFLAIIPYIGIVMGALPPILFAFLIGDSIITPLLVIGVFAVVQFLEGNFISPNIIGSKVEINPFVALIALIVGGGIWGIAGMILFVPLIGILRVIFIQIEELKPYGYLLGNTVEYEKVSSEKIKEK
jgi:predicted PurR-regulated permease PerM